MGRNKPETIEIIVKYQQSQNYTPADAIRKWAKENRIATYTDKYFNFNLKLMLFDSDYIYDHWEVKKHDDGTESVILTLRDVES